MNEPITLMPARHEINRDQYNSLMTGNKMRVADICHRLHVITVNDNAVLHMATRAKEAASLTHQSRLGNTILHETATRNHAVSIAVQESPGIVWHAKPQCRESSLSFSQLLRSLDADLQFYVHRSNKTIIPHIAIVSQYFGKR
uniref:Uncharacterized protein n=1 Tax=Salix viminalis TaxID=40686 RepID=A0A6N2LCE0_SALVM